VVEDALKELERRRIEMIVSLVEQGQRTPHSTKSHSPHLTRFGTAQIWDCRAASPHFWQAR